MQFFMSSQATDRTWRLKAIHILIDRHTCNLFSLGYWFPRLWAWHNAGQYTALQAPCIHPACPCLLSGYYSGASSCLSQAIVHDSRIFC